MMGSGLKHGVTAMGNALTDGVQQMGHALVEGVDLLKKLPDAIIPREPVSVVEIATTSFGPTDLALSSQEPEIKLDVQKIDVSRCTYSPPPTLLDFTSFVACTAWVIARCRSEQVGPAVLHSRL